MLESSRGVRRLGGVCDWKSQIKEKKACQLFCASEMRKKRNAREGLHDGELTLPSDDVEGGVERNNVQREGGKRKDESERVRDDELHGSD